MFGMPGFPIEQAFRKYDSQPDRAHAARVYLTLNSNNVLLIFSICRGRHPRLISLFLVEAWQV